jgi:hypothetical protein
MNSYCVKCKRPTVNIKPVLSTSSNGRHMIKSKCGTCDNKKNQFVSKAYTKNKISGKGIGDINSVFFS